MSDGPSTGTLSFRLTALAFIVLVTVWMLSSRIERQACIGRQILRAIAVRDHIRVDTTQWAHRPVPHFLRGIIRETSDSELCGK